MKKSQWLRFRWELAGLPARPAEGTGKYSVRQVEKKEKDIVLKVVESSFHLDSEWYKFSKDIDERLSESIEISFACKEPSCIALVDGSRIVGVSVFDLEPGAASNLASGPCVLIEYRSRGFGTMLLRESLAFLRESGLEEAFGLTPAGSVAAKFVYPKFDGRSEPYTFLAGAES